ncbi:MAG: retropepsin-like aspartic protease [Flavobacteriaceae bacterium]|tara:strand:+ start:3904 stop:5103 length:1200 start_codon:yes stop_codon:yes gene_type:complete
MNKVILNICLFFILTNITYAQKANFKTGTPKVKNYYTEIKYKNLKGKIIIPVTINNKTYNFLFDTGAPNLISKNIWEKINSKSIKSISISDANQKKQDMVLATIPMLTLGNVTFKNTSTLVFTGENNLLFDCYKIDGIIGSNLLRKSIVQIKSKDELIILTNNTKKLQLEAANKSKLTLVGKQSSPYININLKGESSGSEILLFDTGASGFYDLNKRHFETFDKKNITQTLSKANGSSSVGLFGVANKSEQYRIRVAELKINNYVFKNVISITGNDNNSRIGSDILDYGIVTLDFRKKLFYFEGYKSVVDLNEKLLGFSPTIENNKLVVGFVWDDSLKDKIEFGDEIIEINEINIQENDICDLITKKSLFEDYAILNFTFINPKGKKTKLTLKRELNGK